MRCTRLMQATRRITGLLAGLLFAMLAIPLAAQSSPELHPFSYDITREVTLSGTVSSVLLKPAPGMVVGSHLLLTTPTGRADVSLGRFGLSGRGALSVAAGQQIEVTGVMKTLKDQPVFLARTVKVGSQTYTIRSEHGVEVSPQARERAAQKGDSL
jgi:hypothetical protein